MDTLAELRARIRHLKLADEQACVGGLLRRCRLTDADGAAIGAAAVAIVDGAREDRHKQPLLDAFLQEYGLSNEEGVGLMCLAEALLRVPDAATRDDLIADKIAPGHWLEHAGKSDSLFVNASTWGLMLTGRVVRLDPGLTGRAGDWLGGLTNRLGEPVIRAAMTRAMQLMGDEFVLGETIEEAIVRGRRDYGPAQIYSFDMLGEGARTGAQAAAHFAAYLHAIEAVGALDMGREVEARSGVSIKLSALHPRYEAAKRDLVLRELGERVLVLATAAAKAGIKLSIDAEEADRLDLSLDLFERVARAPGLHHWPGLGLVVQAYGKRAPAVIDWADALARETGRRFMVRLVKGAYWDAEIKQAQALGLADFPVFTRKASTDLSYLVCAQDLLARRDRLHCQFATHNAHTIAAVLHMAQGDFSNMELQRLHGMGDLVYAEARERYDALPPVRIYAPVGGHKDLLAYLVRRLLENGANSSFVNRFMNEALPASDIVADPVAKVRDTENHRHPAILRPADLFSPRKAAVGLDLAAEPEIALIEAAVEEEAARRHVPVPLLADGNASEGPKGLLTNPARRADVLGEGMDLSFEDVGRIFAAARRAQPAWDALGGKARAGLLRAAADRLEVDRLRFIALLIREAGKTYADAVAEQREAVDFCRYYAGEAERLFGGPQMLPGPTGEANSLSLHGRGVFLCISPWNFPLAIFTGQVAAALAAGNAVIAKPAEQTPVIAYEMVRLIHAAGVPKSVLQFAPGDGGLGAQLVQHTDVDGVAFTGGTDTARAIARTLAAKDGPIVPLVAETGGQNVMFVDSTALLEQVTDDVIKSAFFSAGQRCSALRVLYLQEDIAEPALTMIRGAMDLLELGDPASPRTDIGPVIDDAAAAALEAHIARMDETAKSRHAAPLPPDGAGGSFVAPRLFEIDTIKRLTQENFGPILHVVRYKASALDAALEEAFSTGYGLTLGVHTRLERRWRDIFTRAPVGNTYINRNMIGAVVGAQPFGGQGLSGTGFKAGGPHYLLRFAREKSLAVNTMATGGNAALLTLGEG